MGILKAVLVLLRVMLIPKVHLDHQFLLVESAPSMKNQISYQFPISKFPISQYQYQYQYQWQISPRAQSSLCAISSWEMPRLT